MLSHSPLADHWTMVQYRREACALGAGERRALEVERVFQQDKGGGLIGGLPRSPRRDPLLGEESRKTFAKRRETGKELEGQVPCDGRPAHHQEPDRRRHPIPTTTAIPRMIQMTV